MQIQARHYHSEKVVQITIFGDVIGKISEVDQAANTLPWIAPAFFDPQINGYGGIWFSSETVTPREVLTAFKPHFAFGISRMFPTLITASKEALIAGFTAVRRACDMEPWADELVAGFHLEGPYISPEDGPRGAHALEHCRAADFDEFTEFQNASGNRIKLVTLAPEVAGAIDFIRQAVGSGVTIAIGHTAANSDQIAAAVEAGATLSTHLGNGAHQMLPRHPNYLWDQLAEPRLAASIISDGFHLPDNVMRSFIAAKGTQNIVLTSDASGLAGCDVGQYDLHGVAVRVCEDKRICLADNAGLLAGSGSSTLDCVNYLIRTGISDRADAIDMAGQTAAELLQLKQASLNSGDRADFILFTESDNGQIEIVATIAAGAIRYSRM